MRHPSTCHVTSLLFVAVLWFATPIGPVAAGEGDALVTRIEQLGGHIGRSESGDIVAIDLANRGTGDEDLRLLSAAPQLQ
ncbi:MAG TPA: hypothetical protein VHK01_22910, partial [Lacipirellulaceae bacterium]|nr:hypothetical protein [Lacipirellulaceae bacterium]